MNLFKCACVLLVSSVISFGADEVSPGVVVKKAADGSAVVGLSKGAAIIVSQNQKGGKMVIVSNVDGVLASTQLADGGQTPVLVQYVSDKEAKIIIQRGEGPVPMLEDTDGDGIPDIKYALNSEGKIQKYRLKSIQWQAVGEAK